MSNALQPDDERRELLGESTAPSLAEDLRRLLNSWSRESNSNSPDHLLATYMLAALRAAEELIRARDSWYGVVLAPGQIKAALGAMTKPDIPRVKTWAERTEGCDPTRLS